MKKRTRYLIAAIVVLLAGVAAWLTARRAIQHARDDVACTHRLKCLGLAIQDYHTRHGTLPPAFVADADGKPMHSWRVLILPFLEERELYESYDFSEPWDSPNNRLLIERMPPVFSSPFSSAEPGRTSFAAVVGPSTVWPGAEAITLDDIGDRSPETIFLVEIADSDIAWTEPRDVPIDGLLDPTRTVNRLYNEGRDDRTGWCMLGDANARRLPPRSDEKLTRALLTKSAGDYVGDFFR
jgi:hypothetical protein